MIILIISWRQWWNRVVMDIWAEDIIRYSNVTWCFPRMWRCSVKDDALLGTKVYWILCKIFYVSDYGLDLHQCIVSTKLEKLKQVELIFSTTLLMAFSKRNKENLYIPDKALTDQRRKLYLNIFWWSSKSTCISCQIIGPSIFRVHRDLLEDFVWSNHISL